MTLRILAALSGLLALTTTTPAQAAVDTPADVAIGGEVVLRLRATAGGRSPADRAADITDRLVRLVGVPDLTPADVAVYTPWRGAPVIYVLGRKLITVDTATAKASGIGKPIDVATKWAQRLQQVLPRVDIRLPNEPEPVVPANPPLTITSNITQVGGEIGEVILRDKLVMRLRGPQPRGMTPAERADVMSSLLSHALHATDGLKPEDIHAELVPPGQPFVDPSFVGPFKEHPPRPAALKVGERVIAVVDYVTADAAGAPGPLPLAEGWVKNIRKVVFPPSVAPPVDTPAPSEPTAAPSAPTPPAVAPSPAAGEPTPSSSGTDSSSPPVSP